MENINHVQNHKAVDDRDSRGAQAKHQDMRIKRASCRHLQRLSLFNWHGQLFIQCLDVHAEQRVSHTTGTDLEHKEVLYKNKITGSEKPTTLCKQWRPSWLQWRLRTATTYKEYSRKHTPFIPFLWFTWNLIKSRPVWRLSTRKTETWRGNVITNRHTYKTTWNTLTKKCMEEKTYLTMKELEVPVC